jgi:hypothetical protein
LQQMASCRRTQPFTPIVRVKATFYNRMSHETYSLARIH